MPNFDPKIAAIVKALAFAENGGHPDVKNPKAGKTGEAKSIFQFTPDTWKIYSKQASGQEGLPMTAENEAQVVYHKVGDWVGQGYNVEQIASMWNAGEQRPDAYRQNWKGVNKKYGVAYDTPAYAKKVSDYVKKFEESNNGDTGNGPVNQGFVKPANNPSQPLAQIPQAQNKPTLPDLMKSNEMKKVREI